MNARSWSRYCTLETVASVGNLYQFSREGNSGGLRRACSRWPLDARLKRRQRKMTRVLRGGSWINDNPDNLLSSYRNNNTPDNRNDNNGFRVVLVGSCSSKAATFGVMSGGDNLPGLCQEASLTVVPAPVGKTGKDAVQAVAGKPELKVTACFSG